MNHAQALSVVNLLDHPLARVNMTSLRDKRTSSSEFRRTLRRTSAALAWFSLQDIPTQSISVTTPLMDSPGHCLERPLVLVPVLRAGLGFAESMLEVLPEAEVGHIGLARDETTHRPSLYYCKLPKNLAEKEILVLDPMLATGHSAAAALSLLKESGARHLRFVGLVGCPEGVSTLRKTHPDVSIYLAALDEGLNENCYILPGLGDAGDRYFGTVQ
jgi:uracil phosphoribosyltransferase